jgi:serine-type D-Ala-D-Ala endopeptidase (penicillin-binding protein 7)
VANTHSSRALFGLGALTFSLVLGVAATLQPAPAGAVSATRPAAPLVRAQLAMVMSGGQPVPGTAAMGDTAATPVLVPVVEPQGPVAFDYPAEIGELPTRAPDWFPESVAPAAWSLEGIGGAAIGVAGPSLHSRTAFVYDVDQSEVLLSVRGDERRPVASLTKVMAALALVSEQPDLDAEVCVGPAMWVGWPGASSKLHTGTCTAGWDLLGAALVHSDNRAAYGLGVVSGLPYQLFVERMNQVALDIGMGQSVFSDPSGVEDENLSTARDMTRAVLAAALHPVLGPVASAPWWDVDDHTRGRTRRMFSTNKLRESADLEFLAAKTGYTDTARYCFTAVVRTAGGRTLALTTLGANRPRQRWSDVRKLLTWAEKLDG